MYKHCLFITDSLNKITQIDLIGLLYPNQSSVFFMSIFICFYFKTEVVLLKLLKSKYFTGIVINFYTIESINRIVYKFIATIDAA